MQTSSPDFLWEVAFGSWTDVMACAKRAKKFAKLGIYVEIEELTRYQRKQLTEAMSEGKDGSCFGILQPFRKLVRNEFDITKHEYVYMVCLYGPARKNIAHVAPKKPGKQMPMPTEPQKATEKSKVNDAFFVIQQIFPGAHPHVSMMFDRETAENAANTAKGVISYIVQVVKSVDNRVDPRKQIFEELAAVASRLSANPCSVTPEDFEKMRAALAKLEGK